MEICQRRPGGGAELPGDTAAVDGDALKKLSGCRRGHGEDPVGAADPPTAHMNGAGLHPVGGQLFHQVTDGSHIRQSIQGPHLMKVDLLHGDPVDLAFRCGDIAVDLTCLLRRPLGQIEMGDHMVDGGRGA